MYEIPQQLEYKEKIIFGLTFQQLIYAMIFLPFAIICFRLNVSLPVKVFLTLIPVLLASGFMFFDLSSLIKNWYGWYKLRKIEVQEKIRQVFDFKEIKDNYIFTKKKIAVLKIEPINFSIKPTGEQEAIILSFQKFLNSLDFKVQLLMTTETLNLEDYLVSLKERLGSDENSNLVFEEYKNHIKNIIKENSVMNRNFYLIIPEKTNITIQLKICEERLNSLNLKTKILVDNELKDIFVKILNSEDIFPKKIDNEIDFVKVDDKLLNKVIYAHGYPRMVESGFLDKIVSCSGNFDLSLHIEPYALENTIVILNKELQKQRADLYSAKLKGQFNPSLEIKYEDTQKTLESLQKGREKLFNLGFYINCRAKTKEELDLLTTKIESELNSLLILPKQPQFRMLQGLKSCLPIAENSLAINRNITTSALSAFFPFTSSFFKFDKTGIWFGLNKNKIPIIRDIFKLSNSNGICLASSGSGKSYMAKLFISRYLLNGTKVIVIDPQGEYVGLVDRFKGQRIDLSRTSDTIINPLDLMGHDYPEKRLALMDLMPVMLGELTEPQKSFIDRALTEAYELKGIYMDEEESWTREPPILEDVLKSLMRMEKGAIILERSTIRSLINRLDIYVNGVFSFLNKHSNINFNNRFVCFDIGNLPKQVKPTMMFLVLDYVYTKMKKDLERKILVIDEAWALLGRTEDASYIFEIVKTCRKFNLGLFLINQEVEGMLESQAGRSVLANTSYTILLKQKPAVIEDIQETFHLSNTEKISLLTAGVGEGLLLMEDEHSELKIVASDIEHKQITTNADEILANQEPKKPEQIKSETNVAVKALAEQHSKINVNEKEGFFRHKNLSLDEIKYLIHKKYREYSFYSILSNKKERYLLRPRFNESPQHCFLTYEIADYLKKFTDKVSLYQTKRPDIVFELNNKKYAIEIETGKIYNHDKKKLSLKVDLLNKEFGKNWFFVVTNRNLAQDYKKFGDVCDKRYIGWKINQIMKGDSTKSPEKTAVKIESTTIKKPKIAPKSPPIIDKSKVIARSHSLARFKQQSKCLTSNRKKIHHNLKGGAIKNGKEKRLFWES